MSACRNDRTVAIASARLLIHTGNRRGAIQLALALALHAIRLSHSPWKDDTPVQIDVEHIGGRRVLSLDAAAPLIDLDLPPGTYQVTARHGNIRRGYTLTLERDTSFDLYLSLANASG